MKRIFLLLSFFVTICSMVAAQNQKTLARFYVTHATNNGVDVTEEVTSWGLYTVFYLDNGDLRMANVSANNDTQSYGGIFNMRHKNYPETDENYACDVFMFNWSYINDYDSKKGTCAIEFTKVYKPQGIVSILKMVTESLDVIEYTGYMEGSLDFSDFL